jgi:CelD/BcsL family acetyltransferase involved in cellulose biosynthesis
LQPSSRGLTVQTVDDFAAVAGLETSWNQLLEASAYPNVFLRWEWLHSWWKWFGAKRGLRLTLVHDGPQLVGILPLYVAGPAPQRASGPKRLTLLGAGGPTYPEYLGPIIHRQRLDEVLDQMVHYLQETASTWDVIEFPDVAPDDPGTTGLVEALRRYYPAVDFPGEACPYLKLEKNYEALLKCWSSHRQDQCKRRLRKANKQFQVELQALPSPEAIAAVFPTLCKLNSDSRAIHAEPSPFANPQYAGFHREIMEELLPGGITKVYVLTFDGTPVAFDYGFTYLGKYYCFQTGFQSDLKKYSPGDVVLQLVFDDLMKQHVTEFDFLRGDEAYKMHFAREERRTRTTYVYRRTGWGYLRRVIQVRVVSKLRRAARRSLDRLKLK